MRNREELIAEHERYLYALHSRFRSAWPSRLDFSGAPRRTIGPFGLFGDDESFWFEPQGSEPTRAELLDVLADEVWNADQDPYLSWWQARYPSLGEVVESVRAAVCDLDWYLHLDDNSSFLYVVDQSSFRPAIMRSDVEIRRATLGDDLGLLSKVLSVAESYPQPDVDASLGVRALPGYFGDSRLRPSLEDGSLRVFFTMSDAHPVAVGLHRPLDRATEIRVGCLPESRREGFGGAVIEALVGDAFEQGVEQVFVCRDVDDPRSLFGFSMVSELHRVEFVHLGGLAQDRRAALRGI